MRLCEDVSFFLITAFEYYTYLWTNANNPRNINKLEYFKFQGLKELTTTLNYPK